MKNSISHLPLILLLLCICTSGINAQNRYNTDLLERMAEALSQKQIIMQWEEGEHDDKLSYRGKPLTVIIADGEVQHIGYRLFNAEERRKMPSPVYNFIERYALALDLPLKREKTDTRQIAEDHISFSTGTFSSLFGTKQDLAIEMHDGRDYTVSWKEQGKTSCCMNFPADYTLLHGSEMMENERRLSSQILRHKVRNDSVAPVVTRKQLMPTWQNNYFILSGESYYMDQLNTNLYYERISEREDAFRLVYNERYPLESLANLFTTTWIPNSFILGITLCKYGHSKESFEVPLTQWTDYCLKQGCKPYFGVISYDGETATCSLIMRNEACGYNHILKASMPMEQFPERRGLITARLYAYVPTYNIKYLFEEFGL